MSTRLTTATASRTTYHHNHHRTIRSRYSTAVALLTTLVAASSSSSSTTLARAFSTGAATRHHYHSLPKVNCNSNSVGFGNKALISLSARGGGSQQFKQHIKQHRQFGPSLFSTTAIEETTTATMDDVKLSASKMSAEEKLSQMREKMAEWGVDGTFSVVAWLTSRA
eukprot:scaffold693_cov200-Alexandrium_tamarense.AAC.18